MVAGCALMVALWTPVGAGCTAAQGQVALSDLQKADDAILAAVPVTCAIADAVDPAGGAVVCAVVTAAGDLVNVVTTQLTPAVAAAVVAAHPSPSPAVTAKLKGLAKKPGTVSMYGHEWQRLAIGAGCDSDLGSVYW
jgi:hypothetical protein